MFLAILLDSSDDEVTSKKEQRYPKSCDVSSSTTSSALMTDLLISPYETKNPITKLTM